VRVAERRPSATDGAERASDRDAEEDAKNRREGRLNNVNNRIEGRSAIVDTKHWRPIRLEQHPMRCDHPPTVIPGLDPGIHMDGQVKPGHDE